MKRVLFSLLFLLFLPLCGCGGTATGSLYGNFREIERLQLVQTYGYDRHGSLVTVSTSSGPGTDELPSTLLTGSGETLVRANQRLQDYSTQEELFFAHIQYIIIGEEAARAGITDLLDWFERTPQTRLDIPLFLAQGGGASALVTETGDGKLDITAALSSLKTDAERQGSAYCFSLCDMARQQAEQGCALCCAIRRAATGEHVPSAEKEGAVTPLVSGYAVFQDERLLRCVEGELSSRLSLLLGKAGAAVVDLPDGQGGSVSVMLDKNEVALACRWGADGVPELHVTLCAQGGVLQMEHSTAAPPLGALDAAFTRYLAESAQRVIALSAELNADLLGLGPKLRRADRARFEALGEDWLRTLRCTVDAQGKVARSFDLTSPGKRGAGHG